MDNSPTFLSMTLYYSCKKEDDSSDNATDDTEVSDSTDTVYTDSTDTTDTDDATDNTTLGPNYDISLASYIGETMVL